MRIFVFFSGAKFAFSIYDFEGKDTVDAFDLGSVLRALSLVPTLKTVEKLGGEKKKGTYLLQIVQISLIQFWNIFAKNEGQKKFTIEEFLAIYSQAKKDTDVGNFDDFKECLKLYDKSEDGTMIFDELRHILLAMGISNICKWQIFWTVRNNKVEN